MLMSATNFPNSSEIPRSPLRIVALKGFFLVLIGSSRPGPKAELRPMSIGWLAEGGRWPEGFRRDPFAAVVPRWPLPIVVAS